LEGIRDPINWIGITVFFGSVFAYAYFSYEAKQAAKKAAAATAPSGDAKPTETNKLVHWIHSKPETSNGVSK